MKIGREIIGEGRHHRIQKGSKGMIIHPDITVRILGTKTAPAHLTGQIFQILGVIGLDNRMNRITTDNSIPRATVTGQNTNIGTFDGNQINKVTRGLETGVTIIMNLITKIEIVTIGMFEELKTKSQQK